MAYVYNMTATWNEGATQFFAIKMDVTDTASLASSRLIDLQVGGASKFYVDKAGLVQGRDMVADGTKLDGIDTGATDDQTGAEIKALYEAETSAFTDALFTKLSNIETAADVTDLTNVSSSVDGGSTETTIADGDFLAFLDITASNVFKKITWSNFKLAIKAYTDTLYATISNLNLKAPLASPSFTGDITLSDATPTITLTDTTDSSDSLVAYDAAALDISVDENNEAANSEITFSVDGTEVGNINDFGLSVGTAAGTNPADASNAFKTINTGSTGLLVQALSSGAANDDYASIVINSAEAGATFVQFYHDNVFKAQLGWEDGNGNIFLENYATGGFITFYNDGYERMRMTDVRVQCRNSIFNIGLNKDKTIASGALTITAGDSSNWAVDTESTASTDDLDTINGGASGDMLFIRAKNDARTVVLKHGTGNIYLDGLADKSLTHTRDQVLLFNTGTVWRQIGFGDNAT